MNIDLGFKRLARINDIEITYHLVGDTAAKRYKTRGKTLCDAFNELMVSLDWKPFMIDTIIEG